METPSIVSETSDMQKPIPEPAEASASDDIIMLNNDSDPEDSTQETPESTNEHKEKHSAASTAGNEDDEDEPMSLSELSSSFRKCFHSKSQNNKARQSKKSEESTGLLLVKPFDYDAALKEVKFGEDAVNASSQGGSGLNSNKKKSSVKQATDLATELRQGRRRQAFPASGNRSATFR